MARPRKIPRTEALDGALAAHDAKLPAGHEVRLVRFHEVGADWGASTQTVKKALEDMGWQRHGQYQLISRPIGVPDVEH